MVILADTGEFSNSLRLASATTQGPVSDGEGSEDLVELVSSTVTAVS